MTKKDPRNDKQGCAKDKANVCEVEEENDQRAKNATEQANNRFEADKNSKK
jgi:hypothetical protein